MYYATDETTIAFAEIKAFDSKEKLSNWIIYNEPPGLYDNIDNLIKRFELPQEVGEAMIADGHEEEVDVKQVDGVTFIRSYGNDSSHDYIDPDYRYYAASDNDILHLDIECFRTKADRDKWLSEADDDFRVAISGRLAKALTQNYEYIEDFSFTHDGIIKVAVSNYEQFNNTL